MSSMKLLLPPPRKCPWQEEKAHATDEAEQHHNAEKDAVKGSVDAHVLADAKPTSLLEEGEVKDDVSQPAVATTGRGGFCKQRYSFTVIIPCTTRSCRIANQSFGKGAPPH